MQRRLMLCSILLLICFQTNAQKSEGWKFGMSLMKESFFYPSISNFIAPYHPGLSVVGEKMIKTKEKSQQVFSLEGGFYHHKYFQNGLFFLAGINYQYPLKSKLKLRWGPRIGYLHTFSPTGRYSHIDGEFRQVKDWGRPTVLAGVAIGAEYPIIHANDSDKAIDLFFNYQVLVEGPFAPGAGVPVVPHTFLSLGVKTKLF